MELPANPPEGTIVFYNAGTWQVLIPGVEDQVLTLDNGLPVWTTPSTQTDSLLQVGLPDGDILYVHPTDNSSSIVWGIGGNDIPGLDNTQILDIANMDFKGAANTLTIVRALGGFNSGNYAAKLCADLVAFGFDDWYLPAAGELNIMYQQLGPSDNGFDGSGDITSGIYPSSSEFGAFFVWSQSFESGFQDNNSKGASGPCRCVRR